MAETGEKRKRSPSLRHGNVRFRVSTNEVSRAQVMMTYLQEPMVEASLTRHPRGEAAQLVGRMVFDKRGKAQAVLQGHLPKSAYSVPGEGPLTELLQLKLAAHPLVGHALLKLSSE